MLRSLLWFCFLNLKPSSFSCQWLCKWLYLACFLSSFSFLLQILVHFRLSHIFKLYMNSDFQAAEKFQPSVSAEEAVRQKPKSNIVQSLALVKLSWVYWLLSDCCLLWHFSRCFLLATLVQHIVEISSWSLLQKWQCKYEGCWEHTTQGLWNKPQFDVTITTLFLS